MAEHKENGHERQDHKRDHHKSETREHHKPEPREHHKPEPSEHHKPEPREHHKPGSREHHKPDPNEGYDEAARGGKGVPSTNVGTSPDTPKPSRDPFDRAAKKAAADVRRRESSAD